MKATIEVITPSMADEYLKLNTQNRSVRRGLVSFLKDEILDGRWQPNGATIVFSKDRLLDGQHRLLAVVAAKKPIRSLVVHGVPSEYFSTIDIGTPRRPADVLQMKGEKNVSKLAGAVMWVLRYHDGIMLAGKRMSATRVEQFLDSNRTIRKSLEICLDIKLMNVSVAAACHFMFHKKDETLADLFINGIKTGFTRSDGDPFFGFRERMIENQASAAKLHPVYVMALMIKAWNLMRKKDKLEEPLVFKPYGKRAESFPVIV